MEAAANTRRAKINSAWIGLGVGDEIGNRLGRNRRVHHYDIGTSDDARDRRNVSDEIEIELVVDRRVGRVRSTTEEKRVSVGRRTHDRLGPDIIPGTRSVLDDEWLAETLRQPLAD